MMHRAAHVLLLVAMVLLVQGKEEGVQEAKTPVLRTPMASTTTRHARSLIANRQYCSKTSATEYKTVNVGLFGRLMGRARRHRAGNCANMCAQLCNHVKCSIDYSVDSSNSCTCLKGEPVLCNGQNTVCNPTSDQCECKVGFSGDKCVDIDECKVTPSICGGNLKCTNAVGGYTCSQPTQPVQPTQPASSPAVGIPNSNPVATPAALPVKAPTKIPTKAPTKTPTKKPTAAPKKFPTLAPVVPIAPTPVPPALRAIVDNDLISIAKNASFIKASLKTLAEAFEANKTEARRHDLQEDTLSVLAAASTADIQTIISSSPVLQNWNFQGNVTDATGYTKREQMCDLISSPTSNVSIATRSCMCGKIEPYVRCDMWLGNEAWQFREKRRRQRRLAQARRDKDQSQQQQQQQQQSPDQYIDVNDLVLHRALQSKTKKKCDATVSPIFQQATNFNEFLLALQSPGLDLAVTCCLPLQPFPLNLLEVCGTIRAAIPNVPWLTVEGARQAINDRTIVKGSTDLKTRAKAFNFGLDMDVCFILAKVIEKHPDVEDIMVFLGLDCFAGLSLDFWPASGSAQAVVETTIGIFYAKFAMLWQMDTTLRDTLGLCDNVNPSCGDIDADHCKLGKAEVAGRIDFGFNLFLFPVGISQAIGSAAYRDCQKEPDGKVCFLGSSCEACRNPATYWYGIAFTACGTEPKYSDGTTCLLGTSCNQCRNPATHWFGAGITKCGVEPCWPKGTLCGLGTCVNCCKEGPDPWACGDPNAKLPYGTRCSGSDCANCVVPATYWGGYGGNVCGNSPNWPDGTACSGLDCDKCRNPENYWIGPLRWTCGTEPKWPDGTTCGLGTTCNQCQNAATHWVGAGITKCGREPCWKRGTFCLLGSTCSSCCSAPGFLSTHCS